jgi:peptidoglycan/LPS O-acetylase OafA/YrhL
MPSFHDPLVLVETISYIPMFIVGALLAKYRLEIAAWYSSLGFASRASILGCGVVCYTYPYLIVSGAGHRFINEPVTTLGCVTFVIAALAAGRVSGVLRSRATVFLGRISYSVYLYHAMILITAVHLLSRRTSLSVVGLIAIAVSLPASALAYYLIEAPSIRWAKRLSEALSPPRHPVTSPELSSGAGQ